MEYRKTVQVAVAPERLWQAVTNVEEWPKWTKSIQRVERLDQGQLQIGSQARIKQPGQPQAVWRVTELEPGKSFVWESSTGGVSSRGGHFVTANGKASSLILTLDQRGALAGLIGLLAGRRTRRYVDMEAEGLRRAAEQS